MNPINIAVVDDQPLVAAAFEMLLSDEPDFRVLAGGRSGRDAVRLCRSQPVDVLLLDIRMPDMDGLAATREITRAGPRPRVIVLTTFNVDSYVVDAVAAGAAGFLLKDCEPAELLTAIRAVHTGAAVISPTATTHLFDAYRRGQPPSDQRPPETGTHRTLARLSPRELDVLGLIGTGHTNSEIADRLVIAESTVKTHVRSVLTKLECRDRVALVVLAHAAGLVR
ncbi:two-component system response regulator [Nocardia nova SH22a]|uniref:Two-component system response regulator n=1 Tax=Nocardia nova SH22a TaxID=1415166 RepID=W5TR28_9NOCA|nr:response regulator transcription factor [Nocardia nova]AHH21373.1 two-component system response regulator [Nocardia nova SH22a]